MRTVIAAVFCVVASLSAAAPAGAQQLSGFANGGFASDLNSSYPAAGGGVVVDLGQPWLSAGVQGDAFFAFPYVSGRGTPFVQVNPIGRRSVRPFLIAGKGYGESAGPMFGAGVELRPGGKLGLRVSFEDYLASVAGFDCAFRGYTQQYCDAHYHGGRRWTGHQISMHVGVLFR